MKDVDLFVFFFSRKKSISIRAEIKVKYEDIYFYKRYCLSF